MSAVGTEVDAASRWYRDMPVREVSQDARARPLVTSASTMLLVALAIWIAPVPLSVPLCRESASADRQPRHRSHRPPTELERLPSAHRSNLVV